NFEDGYSIPHVTVSLENFAASEGLDPAELENTLESARERLFEIRKKRIHPLKDDKVLTSWNGLMIAAFAKGYQAFGEAAYADAAKGSAGFVLKHLRTKEGRLLRRCRNGDAAYPAYLDDYAFLVWGLMELYEATFEVSWLEEAVALNKSMIDIYWDEKGGGLFFSGKGNEALITRSKEIYDGAIPSGNSVAALNLLRLGRITGNIDLEQRSEQLVNAFSNQVNAYPIAYTQFLAALDFMIGPGKEIVVAGDPDNVTTQEILETIQKRFLPNKIILLKQTGAPGKRLVALSPFVEALTPLDNNPTVYVCEQYTCKTPITDIKELEKVIQ
ncbi:MAG: thioredoxin domain-containing protein, partial [Deltaproteobacteria bacterium]|nr:thioredoxin domain-containing protein [Deltaproteobacteria bacterium]